MSRGQAWVSVRVGPVQLPPEHTGSVQVRLWVPVSSQASLNPSHAPQSPQVVAPQPAPSVSRGQARSSLRFTAPQLPAVHSTSVHTRLSIPLSSHPSENPPHAPKLAHEPVPHVVPSVSRAHASDSVPSLETQSPVLLQIQERAVRLRLAPSSHPSAQSQLPQAPNVSAGQSVRSVPRMLSQSAFG